MRSYDDHNNKWRSLHYIAITTSSRVNQMMKISIFHLVINMSSGDHNIKSGEHQEM